MRPVVAAALQIAPGGDAVGLIERCVAETGAELLVLPEAMTTGFSDGDVAGVYRKTHLFHTERAWCVPGDEPVVVDTELGRIGLIICFDGDFPELAGVHYFGNSMIVGPTAEVLARTTSQEGWAVATLDPDAFRAIAPGSSVPQSFDHLEDRNVGLYARHRAELESPARALA